MPIKRIDFDVLTFIKSLENNSFTISNLLQHYMKSDECGHDETQAARQYLYRNVMKLQKVGNVYENGHINGKEIRYCLTQNNLPSTDQPIVNSKKPSKIDSTLICNQLLTKIRETKLSLLTRMGETEAYKEWVNENPLLKSGVQDKYNSAKDDSSKLLGKVNAYETLLAMYRKRPLNET